MNEFLQKKKGFRLMNDEKNTFDKCSHGGYISKLYLNNNQVVDINKDDIVILVGPNNAGKSRALYDIYQLCEKKMPTIVVKDLEIVKYDKNLDAFLKDLSEVKGCGKIDDRGDHTVYSGLNYSFNSYTISNYAGNTYYGNIRNLFVAYLNTLNRLTISNPANQVNRKGVKEHPIQIVASSGKYRKWLSLNFKNAFGKELISFTQNGATIPLCIGEPVKLEGNFNDEQERQEAFAEILDTYDQVQNQGDGIKSFTGILLYLMIDYISTFLIDEPESFLHPPQATIMGRIIGKTLRNDQQAFISTHSEEIIKGILEVCPQRVKIIRITRNENCNSFSILDNNKFSEIWNDPLLKYSNIMTSLFHKDVVLCESDSDCKMYSIVERHLKEELGQYSETLFIHCNGKHRMGRIAKALKSLDIKVKLIPDIDVLNNENMFREIIEAFGLQWNSISKEYRIIVSNLHSSKESVNRNQFKTNVLSILDSSTKKELSGAEIKKINEELRIESKWESLKKYGVSALPRGDATASFETMNRQLQECGIYIVPVGELECFIRGVGSHGPDWTNKVLEQHSDLNDEVYDDIKKFIKEVCDI